MTRRFPDYDVLAKRDSQSWNAQTRQVVDERLALTVPEDALAADLLDVLRAVVARVCPDPEGRRGTTTVAMIAHRIAGGDGDGFRHHRLPPLAECWRKGLAAIDDEARARHGIGLAGLDGEKADDVLRAVSQGEVQAAAWDTLPPKLFWQWRLIPDCVSAHWAQPALWSDMGFGGPAAPRGYVRMGPNRRDPWEAQEAGVAERGLPRHHA